MNKIYAFLPQNNPYYREFLELKAAAAEAEGDVKGYASVLDTLEMLSEKYFGKTVFLRSNSPYNITHIFLYRTGAFSYGSKQRQRFR